MKKTTQILYIVLFVLIIGIGTLCNLPKLFPITKEITEEEKYEAWTTLIGLEYSEQFFDKYFFVDANGFFHKVMGQRKMKDVVKTDTGKLVTPVEEAAVWEQVEKTKDLYQWLQEEKIAFSYVQVPYEICKYEDGLPKGIRDYSNQNADNFLLGLKQADIPVYDLREEMHATGLSHNEAFFKTDHHWTIETAFWAFGIMVDYLENILLVQIPDEYTDLELYNLETRKEKVLGSNGRRTGISYGGLDELTLIYPKFTTQLTFEAVEEKIYREGDFKEAYMVYERLEGDNLYEMGQYDVYIGEDYPSTTQRCEDAPCNKKILLIKDSYFRPVQAFLGLIFTEVDTIDMRYYEGDVKQYITEMQPDVVLLCYNPYMLSDLKNFRFAE